MFATPAPLAAKYTKRGSILLRVRVVGPSYRPDPAVALAFCGAHSAGGGGSSSGATTRSDSRASRSLSTSMPDSAFDTSGRSTPTGVLPTSTHGAGRAGGKAAGAAAGGSHEHALYQHRGYPEHDSVQSLDAAGSVASDAAALLSRQAAAASSGELPSPVVALLSATLTGLCL